MKIRSWIMALRLHTLPASVSPILVAGGLAYRGGVLYFPGLVGSLLGAMLLQLGTNLVNDYQDAKRGADTEERVGFTRVTQSGLLEANTVLTGARVCFGLAMLVGIYLTYLGGWPIVVIGTVGILCAIGYTGGPVPYGYLGLGDLMVFVFFGPVAVAGTVWVQYAALTTQGWWIAPEQLLLWPEVWVASLAPGCLITAILVVNNHRDRETDRVAGKRTLAVRLGPPGTRIEYFTLLVVGFLTPVILWLGFGISPIVLISLVAVIFAYQPGIRMLEADGEQLNDALSQTGRLAFVTCLGLGLGLGLG